jgi:hypothetical protein
MTQQTPTSGSLPRPCSPIVSLGRFRIRIGWEWEGYWITSRKSCDLNRMWLWLGTTRSADGLLVVNCVVGPLGIAIGVANAQVQPASPAENSNGGTDTQNGN